jgi:hypothetical protein
MSTEAWIAADRANALKSAGPVNPFFPESTAPHFARQKRAHARRIPRKPSTATEVALVDAMATARWPMAMQPPAPACCATPATSKTNPI